MITQIEIKEKSRENGVPVSTIERDYAQNWLLKLLSSFPSIALKGGTGIKKVYIGNYRFSDDLDFSLLEEENKENLEFLIKESVKKAKEESGINFSDDISIDENDNGFEMDVYFQIMQRGESRTRIKIDITKFKNEEILLPLYTRKIIHPYSDDLNAEIKVYSLDEIVAEKVRSLFQRTRPRDLYDVWFLWNNIDRRRTLNILHQKFKLKNVEVDIKDLDMRKDDFKYAWENSLKHQLKALPDFNNVFSVVLEGVRKMYFEIIKNKRETILKGEIGALLHDIGKLHPNFIKKQSLENIRGLPHHADIDEFINAQLLNYFKDEKLKIKLNNDENTVYDLIKEHHHNTKSNLLKALQRCDRKDSADDKGIVRKKQSTEDTVISSPFGYSKEKIDLNCLQKRFNDLEDNLMGLFKNYIAKTMDLSCFRKSIIENLKTLFSHALGETRIPSNDVTLWDHSYSTASLFKSALAAIVCGASIDHGNTEMKWRIFSILWNGIEFINKGIEIADIQARGKIIEDIKEKLKAKFEDEIPIGNAIYEDTNGIYFTFPDLDDNSEILAKECADEALKIFYDMSQNELWPIFSLSEAMSSLTAITKEIKSSSEKRKISKITPTLFVEEMPKEFFKNPEIDIPKKGQDVCPICKIRPKYEDKERCDVCDGRKKGRLPDWLNDSERTIWIDDVADKNNRIALISLNFNLDKWLDGTMIGTIYSQSFEDWFNGKKTEVEKNTLQLLKEAGISWTIQPNKETVHSLLEEVIKNQNSDKKKKAGVLFTFFQDVNISERELNKHLNNIKERIQSDLTKENLATYLFTQNPSPARLYRIWREAEEFFDLIIQKIKSNLYRDKWTRIKFSVNDNDLKSEPRSNQTNINGIPFVIKIENLTPETLLVFHIKNGEFYTIESLEKFKFNDKTGEEAVKEALNNGFKYLAREDKPDDNLLISEIKVEDVKIQTEKYYPFIEINKSPLSLRLIAPALDSIKIIELITKLYNEKFGKVIGKLPLNLKLLVANRKFPLYILLNAESRMLEGEEFKKPVKLSPWWNIDGIRNDKYYGFYPINEKGKYTLDDLSPVSNGNIYSLCPGYFDFDLLLGNVDRYKIYYKGKKRGDDDYNLFSARPVYFYQISEILELWEILSNLSTSQINFIEEALTTKLREWRNVDDNNKQIVFRKFAEATLKDAFGKKWESLREEKRCFILYSLENGFFLDTINIFRHIIKKEVDQYE
jgi:CRISPR-associated Csx11 family protein